MEKIEAWKTNDGQIFSSEKDAISHERISKIMEWFHGNNINEDYNIPFGEFLGMLHEHNKSLMKLLKRLNNETLSGQ
jgi:hypothetical protein